MTFNNVSDVSKVGQRAIFFQEGGSVPNSRPFYRGETSTGGWNTPLGDVTAIYLPDPTQPSNWDVVGVTQGQVGLVTSDFTARCNVAIYKKWNQLKNARCPINVFVFQDPCGRKDDPNSWQYVKIYVGAHITDFTDAPDNPLQGDDAAPVDVSGSLTALREYVIFPIKFESIFGASLLADAIDGFFTGQKRCGGKCGERADECNELYVLQAVNTGSPGLSSAIVFSDDNLETSDTLDIPTLGGVSATAMADAGTYLIVISENLASHHYITFSDIKNLDTSGWDSISTNYAGALKSIWAKSPAEIYIGGINGYAYKLTDPTDAPTVLTDGSITTDDLNKVSGWGATVVFGSDNGKVLISENDGDSFISRDVILKDGTTVTGAITALECIGSTSWLLAIGGKLYYTVDTGVSYAEKPIHDAGTVINDISFYDETVGYLSIEVNGAGRVYRTINSGNSWSYQAPYLNGLPTNQRISFVAPCKINKVAAGGRVSVGGDGVLAVAQ